MAASKPLLHPPVSEVAFEINFPHRFAVEKGIPEYQQKVSSQYPGSSEEFILRLPPTAAFGKPTKPSAPRLTPMRSFVFQNTSASRTVKVSVVNLSFIVTDYKDFEEFKRSILSVVLPAVDIFGLETLERVGLRYINKISIPATRGRVAYQEYVRSPINLQAFPSNQLTNFLAEISFNLQGGKRITIREGLLPLQEEGADQTYLLDLDCYAEQPDNVPVRNWDAFLDDYHSALETQFKGAVTEKYWNYMERGEAM